MTNNTNGDIRTLLQLVDKHSYDDSALKLLAAPNTRS